MFIFRLWAGRAWAIFGSDPAEWIGTKNTIMLDHATMYQALVAKDHRYEGRFIAAVKTTGIFCRPTCTARKPKSENVEFFDSTQTAIQRGYRPCRICKPLEKPGETPEPLVDLLADLAADPSRKFKDADLRSRGLEPSRVRRWFLKNHGITFHAYQRMYRINTAFKKIKAGASVTQTAYDSGFESLSGFTETFRTIFGVAPSQSKRQGIIDLLRLETPLGTMLACGVETGICLLEFSDRKMLETEFKALSRHYNANIVQGPNPHFDQLQEELEAYFAGQRQQFTVPLEQPGTPFQQRAWQALLSIPYGSTRSYKAQAQYLGQPNAVRAVGTANGMNRLSILVPCHRLVGEDGHLTGYGGGIWRKRWLLEFEQQHRHTLVTQKNREVIFCVIP